MKDETSSPAQKMGNDNNSPISSPENSDDFVLVPNNLPTDPNTTNYDRR